MMLAQALEARGLECVDEPEMRLLSGTEPFPESLGPIEDALRRVDDLQPVVLVNFESLVLGDQPDDPR